MKRLSILLLYLSCCCPQPYGSFPPAQHNAGAGQSARPAWMVAYSDHHVCFELSRETWCGVVAKEKP